jgi:4-carboxymuconolactone decarboxylase
MRHMAYVSSIILATTVGWFFGLMTSPYATSKEPRFPQLTMEQLSDKQKPLGEQIVKVSRVGLAGPYNPMLRSPVFGQKMFDLLYYLRWQTSVPLGGRRWSGLLTYRSPSRQGCRRISSLN